MNISRCLGGGVDVILILVMLLIAILFITILLIKYCVVICFQVPNVGAATVSGLGGLKYEDNTAGNSDPLTPIQQHSL